MRICICTTPIRPYPTDFPPFGSLAIIQSLRQIGEEPDFFNIDYFRHSPDRIEQHFRDNQYDVVGISAVVSTAYAYTKYLTSIIRLVSPHTKIVVGGNLAASAEVLLRMANVDVCVVGDGELIIKQLITALQSTEFELDALKKVKGICFLDEHSKFCFTGYGERPSASEIQFPDYSILESDGSLKYFISDNIRERFYEYDGEVEPGKTVATVVMAKGCVARCTFCHRWEKGFRVLPPQSIASHLKTLISRYNVGFIQVADENFGADRQAAQEIAHQLGELGLRWQVAGVRTSTVTKESLQAWKDSGCISVFYGIESGSQRILEIMEKKTTVEKNIEALKWTGEVGLNTIIQLVIGMPGEDDQTIFETIDFLKRVSPFIKQWQGKIASDSISINYAQALPGTPLYEFAREHGLIESTLEGEERYLISISDTDAYREGHFINMTSLPLLKVLMWRPLILAHLDAHHYKQQHPNQPTLGLSALASYYFGVLLHKITAKLSGKTTVIRFGGDIKSHYAKDSGYFNIASGLKFGPLLLNKWTRPLFNLIIMEVTALRATKGFFTLHVEYWRHLLNMREQKIPQPRTSLRKVVSVNAASPTDDQMLLLRRGR